VEEADGAPQSEIPKSEIHQVRDETRLVQSFVLLSAADVGPGALFLCASIRAPQRMILAVLLIVIGAAARRGPATYRRLSGEPSRNAWPIASWRWCACRASSRRPRPKCRRAGAPAANVQAAFHLLEARREAMPEHRETARCTCSRSQRIQSPSGAVRIAARIPCKQGAGAMPNAGQPRIKRT